MPALPSVANVIRTAIKGVLSEDIDVVNLMYHLYSGSAPTNAELATLAGVYAANWIANMKPLVTGDYTLSEIDITDLSSPTASRAQVAESQNGSNGGDPLGAGSALVVSRTIPRRYRGGHPRVYLAGMPATYLTTSQHWDPAHLANVVTAWQDLEGVPAGNPWSGGGPIVAVSVSYYSGFTNHTYPSGRVRPVATLRSVPLIDEISGYRGNPRVASQRRRNLQSA